MSSRIFRVTDATLYHPMSLIALPGLRHRTHTVIYRTCSRMTHPVFSSLSHPFLAHSQASSHTSLTPFLTLSHALLHFLTFPHTFLTRFALHSHPCITFQLTHTHTLPMPVSLSFTYLLYLRPFPRVIICHLQTLYRTDLIFSRSHQTLNHNPHHNTTRNRCRQ